MASLFYGKISVINYREGTASVTLADRENQVLQEVPFLSICYEMPKPGDTVAVLFEEIGGQIGKGVILGKIFLNGNTPVVSGADIFYKQFTDGASVKYNPSSQEMEVNTKTLKVNELVYKSLIQG